MSFAKKLSIIVSIYNAKNTLERCVNSLLSPEVGDTEIILVDDGSIDGSGQLCDKFSEQHDFIHVVHTSNQGVSHARNQGIEIANGEYLTFVDADDFVSPTYVSDLLRMLSVSREFVLFNYTEMQIADNTCPNLRADGLNPKVLEISYEDVLPLLFEDKQIQGYVWNKVFRKDILADHGIRFEESITMNEDLLFCYSYLRSCQHAELYSKSLYYYVKSEGTAVSSPLNTNHIAGLSSFQLMLQEAQGSESDDCAYIHVAYSYMNWYLLKSAIKRGYSDISLIEILLNNVKNEKYTFFGKYNLEVKVLTILVNTLPKAALLHIYKGISNGIHAKRK